MNFYWSTDLEPKVPLPDCASRFLRLAFFLELSSPEDLRTGFTVKHYVPLSLEKKKTFFILTSFHTFELVSSNFYKVSQSESNLSASNQFDAFSANQTMTSCKLLARDNSDVCACDLMSGLWLAEILKANKKMWKLSSEKVRWVSHCYLTFLTFCQLFHLQLN